MAIQPASPSPDEGRPETEREYHDRVLEQMDRASWRGEQLTQENPPRAIVHEYPSHEEPEHIWRERKE